MAGAAAVANDGAERASGEEVGTVAAIAIAWARTYTPLSLEVLRRGGIVSVVIIFGSCAKSIAAAADSAGHHRRPNISHIHWIGAWRVGPRDSAQLLKL